MTVSASVYAGLDRVRNLNQGKPKLALMQAKFCKKCIQNVSRIRSTSKIACWGRRSHPSRDHSPIFVMRTLPSGCPRTETRSSRAAAYKPERNRLRLRSSVPTPWTSKCWPTLSLWTWSADLAVLARLLNSWTEVGVFQRDAAFVAVW